MKKATIILILFSFFLSGCLRISDHFYRKKKSNQIDKRKNEEINTWNKIKSESDTILFIDCSSYGLSKSLYQTKHWVYSKEKHRYLTSASFGSPWYSESNYSTDTIDFELPLLDYVFENKIDTIKSTPMESGWCDHCGGFTITLLVENDTICNSYLTEYQLHNYSTNDSIAVTENEHPLAQICLRIIDKLEEYEEKN